MPTRRRILATAGTAFALGGCQGLGFGNPDGDATPSPDGTETPSARTTDTPTPDRTDASSTATPRPFVLDLARPSFAETDQTYCAYAIPPEIGVRFDVSTHIYRPVVGN